MLLSDGDITRGNRANFLNSDFKLCGFAAGTHPSAYACSVVLMVDDKYFPKAELPLKLEVARERVKGRGNKQYSDGSFWPRVRLMC